MGSFGEHSVAQHPRKLLEIEAGGGTLQPQQRRDAVFGLRLGREDLELSQDPAR